MSEVSLHVFICDVNAVIGIRSYIVSGVPIVALHVLLVIVLLCHNGVIWAINFPGRLEIS